MPIKKLGLSLILVGLTQFPFMAVAEAKVVIVAPNGKASAAGTLAEPASLAEALVGAGTGDTVYLKSGSYVLAVGLTIGKDQNGDVGKRIALFAYAGEKPILDFSSQPYAASNNPRGLQINGSYWHVRGLEVLGSADNGIYVTGSHNIVEACITHKNRDTGLQIGRASSTDTQEQWPADNLILNCESYDNYDLPPGGGENADGFACKLTAGEGNVFRGCVSHHNIDDGWDLFTKTETGPIGTVVIDQCIAFANGTLTDGTSNPNGDRNGFKLGGDKIAVAHVVTRCVAFANGKNGFTWNSNPGALRLSNNLAFDNVEGNFNVGTNTTPTEAVFTNNVSFWTDAAKAQSDKYIGTDKANSNCWWDKSKTPSSINGKGLVVTSSDFANSLAAPKVSRRQDGSLVMDAFGLAGTSKLLNAGVVPEGSLPFLPGSYYQGSPDLGAVEFGAVTGLAAFGNSTRPMAHTGLENGTPVFRRMGISNQAWNIQGRQIPDSYYP